MVSALSIKELKKTYGNGVVALKSVSLEVEEGDFFALLGPNGAGKTTLIGIVSGLVNKDSGEVKIGDLSIDEESAQAKLHVGVVPQEFNFGIFEKVENIVVDQAGYYGIPRKRALVAAEKYLKQLGLWEKRHEQARSLSGGMKRRLMIARGLVHEPKLLILDEPTAGVDIELRRDMWDFLRELNAAGVTIILTTHYLEEAEQLCRHVAIINQGEIVERGEIKTLLASMEEETFVFDLGSSVSTEGIAKLQPFRASVGDRSVELTLTKEHTLDKALLALHGLGLEVKSLRNKTNRLEEFFVQKTGKSNKS
ncbi:MAG: ABC transporter ATP-binding protein [Candidatus Moraniibacteriota bacterium]|nr:MAG: ABC transporter ATP-binding protein [Candidatus Moranbacteria bacterium]